MPLFRRRTPIFAVPQGDQPCGAKGCLNQTAVPCRYRDRRGRSCGAAFCPDHWTLIGGVVYCRRHASTIVALGARAADPGALPDLENRGPSLVTFIANELDATVREDLQKVARANESVATDREAQVFHDPNRRIRWERAWKLFDHTGVILKVTVFVNESDDTMVYARVGAENVARGVPPWIERRKRGQDVAPDVDAHQRELFFDFLRQHLADGIPRVRAKEAQYQR